MTHSNKFFSGQKNILVTTMFSLSMLTACGGDEQPRAGSTPTPNATPTATPTASPTPDMPDPEKGDSENLLLVENLFSSTHWDRDAIESVVAGDANDEAVATLVNAADTNVWLIFDIAESNQLVFNFNQDPSSSNKVTSWEVSYKPEGGQWENLKSWGDATAGANTFSADPSVYATRIRFRFRTEEGSNLAINQLSLISGIADTGPEEPPTDPVIVGNFPADTDITSYTGPEIGFFENKVFDSEPTELVAEATFSGDVDDTSRLATALRRAKAEVDGGVVILRANGNGQNRFSLSHIEVPSNVRIEVEPGLILEMRGNKETTNAKKQFMFTFGRSRGPGQLLDESVKNVQLTSTVPGEKFTIDATTNMPHNYGYMNGGNGNGIVNLTRAIPIGLFYVENFAISDVNIEDNHTESVAVQMFADADYKDGAFAWRFGSKPVFLEERYTNEGGANRPMNPINIALATNDNGDFVNESGEIVHDMFAIQRNETYGRTPLKGSIRNIKSTNAHTGYGVVQVYGGDWIEIDNIEAFNGIGVRVEAGNGTDNDNFNRSGPYLSSMNKIKISNVTVTNGFTAVWLKPHSKIMKDISVENIYAIDSATALLVGKGSFACGTNCRDLTRGRINNLEIKGDISLTQTVYDKPVAQVGNIATYMINDTNRQYLATLYNKSLTQLSRNDLLFNKVNGEQTEEELALLTPASFDNPSGTRWYTIFPVAPVLALSMLSEDEIGNQSSKVGFFPADFTEANITATGLPEGSPMILYRGDMRLPNGTTATDFIHK